MDGMENLMPREKMLQYGIETLTDVELLALFLRVGTRRQDVLSYAQALLQRFGSLYALLSAGEEPLAYRAAWTLCHLAPTWDAVLRDRYDELVAAALDCPHAGRRRLLLALLYRQPQPEPLRVDFLDFCLDAMTDPAQPHAVRMYCMKLACEMCRTQKDLLHEFRTLVELLEPDLLPPSLRAVRRNVLAALDRNRPLPRR